MDESQTIPEAVLLSVIVPTCDRADSLRRCLNALAGQSLPRSLFEILVTDDGTDPHAALEAEYPTVTFLRGPRKGPAANRNRGAQAAAGRWLVFIDDDCVPDRTLLEAYHTAAANNSGASVLEGRTYADRPKASLCEIAPVNDTGGRLWSCNFAVTRELFLRIGGFDERFPYAAMEDMDLARRISAAGESPLFVPEASVCHPWRRVTTWAPFRRQIESTLLYLELHPEEQRFLNPLHYAKVAVRRFIENTVPALFKGDFAGLKYQLFDHWHSFCMIGSLLTRNTDDARPHNPGASSRH